MKNIHKKSLLTLGSLAGIGIPISLIISCQPLLGKISKYDSDNDNTIVIQTTWSAGGKAYDVLGQIVKRYNDEEKDKPGFMKVQLSHVEGGYGTIPSQLLTKIQSMDTKTLPNVFIDYPSAVGMISPFNMVLNFGGKDGLNREIFEKSFVEVNDKIADLPAGELYSVPLAKSTEGLILDIPLLNYLFKILEKNGIKFQSDKNNPIISKIMNYELTSEMKNVIKDIWGEVGNINDFNIIGNDNNTINTINDTVFESMKGLFDLANTIQVMFPSSNGSNFMGLDSPTNTLYNLINLSVKNDDDKFAFVKDKSTGKIKYDFLNEKSEASTVFKKVYTDYFMKPIQNNSVWLGGGGTYSSSKLVDHYMAISLGSSAGLNKSFSTSRSSTKLMPSDVGFVLPPNKLYTKYNKPNDGYKWEKTTSTVQQGPSFNGVHINEIENKATKRFIKWFYDEQKIHSFNGEESTTIKKFEKESSYIVPLKGVFDNNNIIANMVKDDWSTIASSKKHNSLLGVKMSYLTLKRENSLSQDSDNNSTLLQIPVGSQTGAIRKVLDSKLRASGNSYSSGGGAYGANKIWKDIHDQAIIDGVIEGEINKKEYEYPNQIDRNFTDIDWTRYNYVDAYIKDWTDGDTPNVVIINTHSKTDALGQIQRDIDTTNWTPEQKRKTKKPNEFAIRISGIDTPEAHVKIGDIKHLIGVDKKTNKQRFGTVSDEMMKETIDYYKEKGTPLAIYSHGHYNELSYDIEDKYQYWKNVYIDIQPNFKESGKEKFMQGIISLDSDDYDLEKGYDEIKTAPINHEGANPNAIYDLRNAKIIYKGKPYAPNGKPWRLVSEIARVEGLWGLRASKYGELIMPGEDENGNPRTFIRIATDGKKSYNRIVGTIFFDNNKNRNIIAVNNQNQLDDWDFKKLYKDIYFNSNYSIDILKHGWTLPFLGDIGAVTEPTNIIWETGPGIADALNSIFKNRKALYKWDDPTITGRSYNSLDEWLNNVLATHGTTNYSNLLKTFSNKGSNIYNYLKYRNPIRDRINSTKMKGDE